MLANKLKIGDTIGVISPDKALKNKDKKVTDSSEKISNEVAMTQYNKSIFKKIWNKILSIFKDE